jgi:RNA polymerase sigma factor (sigma-70 family)
LEDRQPREEIVAWVGGQVLPHEADLRAWLRRRNVAAAQIDDVVQDAYCKIAALSSIRHIESGRAYFFQTARNIVLGQIRRSRIVRIDSMTEMEALNPVDTEPSPERATIGRRELERVQRLIEGLPEKCRTIFQLRRIHGVSQKEIAARLGVTENTVETQAIRGLRLILKALEEGDEEAGSLRKPRKPSVKRDDDAAFSK